MTFKKAEIVDGSLHIDFDSGVRFSQKVDLMPKKIAHEFPIPIEEWEKLCTNCGKCCQYRYIIKEDKIEYTGLSCKFLIENKCSIYSNRERTVGGCNKISLKSLPAGMPLDCPYLLFLEKYYGRKLTTGL